MQVHFLICLCIFKSNWGIDLHLAQHKKHRYPLPPSGDLSPASPRSPRSASGDVRIRLNNYQNGQYVGTFTVGGQELPVIYDTGAFGIVVLSDLCHDCRVDGPIYSSSKSLTFKKGQNVDGQHRYETGMVESKSGEETVNVGNTTSPIVGSKVLFWQVFHHDVGHWDRHSKFSGVIGLRLLAPSHGSFAPALLDDVGVTAFSICLESSSGTSPGWFSMGPSVEQVREDPAFKHVPVISDVHWGVQMRSVNAGEELLDVCRPSCTAVIDSGASQIGAPKEAIDALTPVFNRIDPECKNLESLPDISFDLGAERFVIPPSIYVVKMEKEENGQAKCSPNFVEFNMQSKSHGPIWILGIPFLRQYYTVFQHNPKYLHFAHAKPNCQPDHSSKNHLATAFSNHTQRLRGKAGVLTLGRAAIRFPKWASDWLERNASSMPDF